MSASNTCRLVVLASLVLVRAATGAVVSEKARVYKAERGHALAARPDATRVELLTEFLRGRGASDATAKSLRRAAKHRARTGVVHLRMEQEVAGLRVHDAYVKAAFNRQGSLVHVVESVAPVLVSPSVRTRIDEEQALVAALRKLYPDLNERIAKAGRKGNTVSFVKTAFFYDAPRVERVLIPVDGASLAPGFLVETWSRAANQLHETLVDGNGIVLAIERRTSDDRYNVFAHDPGKSAQTVVTGPGAGNAESPAGWLFPRVHRSIHIAGNNVNAYLNVDNDDTVDAGGATVADGSFLAMWDAAAPPATPINQDVAVQNVFYLNNVVHDRLYRHGFTETAGNFQSSNFGKGGLGGDPMFADAQNGADLNNSTISVPGDGRGPRMRIFLWVNGLVVVDGPPEIARNYYGQPAKFGPAATATGVAGGVTLVDDGIGTPTDGCEPIGNDLAGKIALIDRDSCPFTVKVKNAQNAGAVAVIVANTQGDGLAWMDGTDPTIAIPSIFIGRADGQILRSVAGIHATVRAAVPSTRDSALDSDMVWHEYGHGLTWRMIGGMSGPLASAIGEGMSDVLAIVINEDDAVAEFSVGGPEGLRRAPYANYPRTYADVTGAEEHDDGEVYGAIGWRLFEIFRREGLEKDLLLDYLVDGMNYTPRRPSFEDMRDGILAAVTNAGTGHECLIWEAFAQYGVGVGAWGRVQGKRVVIEESFAVPAECAA